LLIGIALAVSFALLILSAVFGVYIGFALALCFVFFALIALRGGRSGRDIGRIALAGAKKGLQIAAVLLLIGALTASWMAAGTVAALVNLLLPVISPPLFLLFCFLIPMAVSFILGSAFATCSTVGVILVILARGGGVPVSMAAGAIFSGAYFGDRASPVSSTLNLVSGLTRTGHYKNVAMMLRTSVIPVIVSAAAYFLWSARRPLAFAAGSASMSAALGESFRLSPVCLLPAALILLLALCRVKVKYAVAASIVCAAAVALAWQGRGVFDTLRYLWSGFFLPADSPLRDVIKGGGLFGQVKNSAVILLACMLSELFQKADMLGGLNRLLARPCGRFALYLRSLALGFVTSVFGCSQTLAIVMTTELITPVYLGRGLSGRDIALDIGLGALIVPAMVPWNVAAFPCLSALGVAGMGYMRYILFIYLTPVYGVIRFGALELRSRRLRKGM